MKKKVASRAGGKVLTAWQWFDKAQDALDQDDHLTAKACFQKALRRDPTNAEVLDAYGAMLAEIGESEEALTVLRRAVELCPDMGYEKFMYLGQLQQGDEAVSCLARGVQLLQQQAETCTDGEDARALQSALCGALCSLAEARLQACPGASSGAGPGAAGDVEALLQRARDADPSSPEPGQALASLRYEQGRPEEALAALRDSLALWLTPHKDGDDSDSSWEDGDGEEEEAREEYRAVQKGGGGAEDMDAEGGDGKAAERPSYEFRFEAAKLLLELDDTTSTAVQILEELIEENDTVAHVWHLLALALYSGGQTEEALEVMQRGAPVLAAIDDQELAVHVTDLEAAIGLALLQGK